MTTRQTLNEEMENIKNRCNILIDDGISFEKRSITKLELESTKSIILDNIRTSIIRIVTAALEESGTLHGLEAEDYECEINKDLIASLEE